MARSVSGALANRLALVRIPCRCASRMPAFTPGVRPKSSPFTTSCRRASADMEYVHGGDAAGLDGHPRAKPPPDLSEDLGIFEIHMARLRQHPRIDGRHRQAIVGNRAGPDVVATEAREVF